jgi:biopolymer transport protein TolQ
MENYLVHLVTLETQAQTHSLNLISIVKQADFFVQIILLILMGMSFWVFFVIAVKAKELSRAKSQTEAFEELFWTTKQMPDIYNQIEKFKYSPVAQSFKKAYSETMKKADIENVQRAFKREQLNQTMILSTKVASLATIASAAPFIGLLGTVWGIMNAFLKIAQEGNATLTTVAPPIAEALIATAVGLFAAIPAVIAYNFLSGKVRYLETKMDTFGNDFLNIIKRSLSSQNH